MQSRTGNDEPYPFWLRNVFVLMGATYGSLWSEQFLDEQTTESIKRVWYLQLKDYPADVIQKAMMDAVGVFKFPPKPADLIDILKAKQRLINSNEQMAIREKNRLLEAPILPPSRKTLEAKRQMWGKLGMIKKLQEVEDEIARMDLQEKRNSVPHP